MTASADLTPAVARLFDRIDVEARDESLRAAFRYWMDRRAGELCPSLAALQLNQMGPASAPVFAFQRVSPGSPDWRLSFAGDEAAGWLQVGEETLLSRIGDRRAAVRLRHLFAMATEQGEPIVASFHAAEEKDAPYEIVVLPIASDHRHPDGVMGAVHRAAPPAGAAAAVRREPAARARRVPPDPLASDLMSTDLETVRPDTPVAEVVRRLLGRGISAVPVVEVDGTLAGIVSEADIVARAGEDPEASPSWWSAMLRSDTDLAKSFVRLHGRTARDVMTAAVVTVGRDASLRDLVRRMAHDRVRRVVVIDGDRPVGIVTRTDVLRAQAAEADLGEAGEPGAEDGRLRETLLERLRAQPWYHLPDRNVVVIDGIACFWGLVHSEEERDALRVAAEEVPGIRGVEMKVEVGAIYPIT